jgi:hypothetical protein
VCPSTGDRYPLHGLALFEVSELTQVAMERAKTAREAIQLMGNLATQYGFYSADWESTSPDYPNNVMGEGGEALTVVDPTEAWVIIYIYKISLSLSLIIIVIGFSYCS